MNNQKPLVTVLVTSYNHQAFVANCIKSILNQTWENIQLIVIDDESPDDSPRIIRELADEYGFTFVPQKNTGLAGVLNNGLSLARGKYFVYVGSDDASMLDRIEKQVELMESRPDVAVCSGNYIIIDEYGVPERKQHFSPPRELGFDDIFLHSDAGIKAPTTMIRTDALKEVGGYDPEIQLEDIYMWLKLTSAGYKAYVLGDVLAYYRKHKGNQSKNINFMADNFETIYGEYKTHPQYEKTINRLLINLFAKSVRRGYPDSIGILKRIRPNHYNAKLLMMVLLWMVKRASRKI